MTTAPASTSQEDRAQRGWSARLAEDLRVALLPFVVARALLALGWLLATAIANRYYAAQPAQIGEGLMAWDGTWYREIAQVGYSGLPEEALRFFPLYPLLGRALAWPAGGSASVPLLIVSNLAALALAVAVRRLVLFEKGDAAVADRATWAITLFPPAFVFTFAYSESIMLLTVVGAFLSARKGRWWWAAGCALLAGASRPVGVAVAAAMAVEAIRGWRRGSWNERCGSVASVASPLVGAAIYLAWVSASFGRWTIPFDVQSELRGETNPLTRMVHGFGDLFGVERFGDGLHVPFAIAFVILLGITFWKWPASYGAYASLVLLAALSASNLNSLERYGLNAFPLVLSFALLLNTRRWERFGLASCGCGFVALTALAWLRIYVP